MNLSVKCSLLAHIYFDLSWFYRWDWIKSSLVITLAPHPHHWRSAILCLCVSPSLKTTFTRSCLPSSQQNTLQADKPRQSKSCLQLSHPNHSRKTFFLSFCESSQLYCKNHPHKFHQQSPHFQVCTFFWPTCQIMDTEQEYTRPVPKNFYVLDWCQSS